MEKCIVAGCKANSNSMSIKVMTINEAISLLQSYRAHGYYDSQIQDIIEKIRSDKGYTVSFFGKATFKVVLLSKVM